MARPTVPGELVRRSARRRRSGAVHKGFTYLMLLWWVAISGVMLAAISQQWRFERQREREVEMVARATEIRLALLSYRDRTPPGQKGGWPRSLGELLEDRRGPVPVRHLRRLWADPLTGRPDWGLVLDGPPDAQPGTSGIRGVFSRGKGRPIRAPAGVERYSDWRFEAESQPSGP